MSFNNQSDTLNFTKQIFLPGQATKPDQIAAISNFLHTHLDEFRDSQGDIRKALSYALQLTDSPGGFVVALSNENTIVGAVVVNKTGMSGYIPENILVYIAVDRNYRGHGLGKQLMQTAIDIAEGDVALHVEPNNPAKFLYEKMGFENKYLEMRFHKAN